MKYGIRTSNGDEQIGQVLPNSFHEPISCDWVEELTELDGTCCFEISDDSEEKIAEGIRACRSFWPSTESYLLISGEREGDAARDGGLPEDGAILIRKAQVMRILAN
jgi:hypothetical protein